MMTTRQDDATGEMLLAAAGIATPGVKIEIEFSFCRDGVNTPHVFTTQNPAFVVSPGSLLFDVFVL
jgi:hypothetical protein